MRALLIVLVLALPASAQAAATATPNTTDSGTVLALDLDTTQPPISSRVPASVTITVQPGFRFDPKAVAKRCVPASGGCPKASRIGDATVTAAALGMTVVVPLDLYLAAPVQPGDIAGIVGVGTAFGSTVSATGRVVEAADGSVQVIVTTPPEFEPYAAFAQAQRVTASVGARRVVKTKVKRKGRKRKVVKKVTHALIRTPPTCTGTWAASAVLAFSDGSSATLDSPIPCAS